MVLIKCGQTVIMKKSNPKFEYNFNGQPVEVKDEHAEFILSNPDFHIVKGSKIKSKVKKKGEVNGRDVS